MGVVSAISGLFSGPSSEAPAPASVPVEGSVSTVESPEVTAFKHDLRARLSPRLGVTLPATEKQAALPLGPDHVLLDTWEGERGERNVLSIGVDDLVQALGVVVGPVSHAHLVAGDLEGKKGLRRYVDRWKEEGLIE